MLLLFCSRVLLYGSTLISFFFSHSRSHHSQSYLFNSDTRRRREKVKKGKRKAARNGKVSVYDHTEGVYLFIVYVLDMHHLYAVAMRWMFNMCAAAGNQTRKSNGFWDCINREEVDLKSSADTIKCSLLCSSDRRGKLMLSSINTSACRFLFLFNGKSHKRIINESETRVTSRKLSTICHDSKCSHSSIYSRRCLAWNVLFLSMSFPLQTSLPTSTTTPIFFDKHHLAYRTNR